MAEYADPVGNGTSIAWTGTWIAVDEAVRDPAAGDNNEITSSTDEAAEDIVFGNTITYTAGATYNLKVLGRGGTKRAVDLQVSVNDGTSWDTRRQIIAAGAAEAWVTVDISSLITGQTALDQVRARFICNSTAGGGGATVCAVDAVYVEKVTVADADAEVAWGEVEVPFADADAELAWAELEVPTADARADVAWAEVEVPTALAAAQVAWAEFQISDPDADAEVSWAELEVPTAAARADVSWAELEVPTADAAAAIGWAEFQVDFAPAAAAIAWAEFEVGATSEGNSYYGLPMRGAG